MVAPQGLIRVGARQGQTAGGTLQQPMCPLLHYHEVGFPLLNPVGACGTQGVENTDINHAKGSLHKEWQRMSKSGAIDS